MLKRSPDQSPRAHAHVLVVAIAVSGAIAVLTGSIYGCSTSGDGGSSSSQSCETTAPTGDAGPCGQFVIGVSGNPDACGFPEGGVLKGSDCDRYCGREVGSCELDLPTGPAGRPVIGCNPSCPVPDAR
jgi:hypothetical protein